jgi:site-specific DNA-methyltransferase (adenine-specific)
MEKLILMLSNEGDNVLDCFLGSGSTVIACLKNNRIPFGCELDKNYFSIIQERIKKI